MINHRALSLIGLATKAGKTASGEFSTEKAIKSGKAGLVLVSEDASDNTKKKFRNMCLYYRIPICFCGDKEELGKTMGKEERSALAVLDRQLAEAIERQIGNQQVENGGSVYAKNENT